MTNSKTTISYLALGDSYTIGESVNEDESFPNLLVKVLEPHFNFTETKIIAKTGYTTNELAQAIQEESITKQYNMVTLLIGVNNQYRSYSKNIYEQEFAELLKNSIYFAKGDVSKVFVLSIPDYSVTPFAKNLSKPPQKISSEIDDFNIISSKESEKYGVNYLDINLLSKKAGNDHTLLAADGLHPSGKMYAEWVALLKPMVIKALSI